jgi:hypothetical protein
VLRREHGLQANRRDPESDRRLHSRAPWGDEDTGEARRAMAQLAKDSSAGQTPEPVTRDIAEQRTKPPAIQAEVHDPGGDVDQVCLPDQLDLQAHGHPRPRRVVLLAGVHAALQPLGRPAERFQHPGSQACALGHVRVAAGSVQPCRNKPAARRNALEEIRSRIGTAVSPPSLNSSRGGSRALGSRMPRQAAGGLGPPPGLSYSG